MQNASNQGIEVSVLGRIDVRRDGRSVDLGTPRQRAIMAALALAEGRPVGFDTLVERVWGDAAPATAVGTMQRYVATLRQALEPGRRSDEAPSVLVTRGVAYALVVPDGGRDVDAFEDAVARARRVLAVVPDPLRPVAPVSHVTDVTAVIALLDDALASWHGVPYADLGDHDGQVVAERARLQDLRDAALELRVVALLALGRHAETVGDLDSMTALHPLHERWWALRAVALVRCGRQAEALEGLSTMRTVLADELGVDPSPPLQQLFTDILHQAPSLAWTPASDLGAAGAGRRRPVAPRRSAAAPASPWPLVGRSEEASSLHALLDRPRAGAALVTGEAGIGKTRLVHDVVQAAGGRGVELATAVCATGAPALWPIRSLLESLGSDTAPLDEPRDDFGVWRAASRALRDVASDQPLLLVVEDLQWADRATVTLLEHLVADHELGEVTLVMTRRTAEGDDAALSRLAAAVARSGGLRVDLTPLSCAEAAELARTVDPQVADPESIGRRAGGNPLFVTALALGDGRVTGTLADVVRARVGGLAPDARVALELASAADGPVDPAFVATVAGCERDDAEAALDAAMRAGLLRGDRPEPTCYRFEHEVVREVLRLDLPSRTRARCRQHAERLAPVRVHRRERSASDPVVAELMRIANPAASAVRAS